MLVLVSVGSGGFASLGNTLLCLSSMKDAALCMMKGSVDVGSL